MVREVQATGGQTLDSKLRLRVHKTVQRPGYLIAGRTIVGRWMLPSCGSA